ncbi:uncharacterized protein BDZ99DRAFT_474441 [Mytilinidion resinicola]|uniref:Uncharacterized protein n=1 Tax=Mytilinidion resinicola TaxID=574789 RepID=A0A6A6YWG3_9PEZI|nr:uncharacterized protein BDZ99DRAFT_474441 [Mytilinidion resinicola]KAF2812237.1 hypothetical protein BDZ99DRAFT_474441 [Mytilinidion resinicola]
MASPDDRAPRGPRRFYPPARVRTKGLLSRHRLPTASASISVLASRQGPTDTPRRGRTDTGYNTGPLGRDLPTVFGPVTPTLGPPPFSNTRVPQVQHAPLSTSHAFVVAMQALLGPMSGEQRAEVLFQLIDQARHIGAEIMGGPALEASLNQTNSLTIEGSPGQPQHDVSTLGRSASQQQRLRDISTLRGSRGQYQDESTVFEASPGHPYHDMEEDETSSRKAGIVIPSLPKGLVMAKPSLMGIPWELRQKILAEVFTLHGPVRGRRRFFHQTRLLRVACVNRQLREETTTFYYQNNTFFVRQYSKLVCEENCIRANPLIGMWLPPLPSPTAPILPSPPDYDRMNHRELEDAIASRGIRDLQYPSHGFTREEKIQALKNHDRRQQLELRTNPPWDSERWLSITNRDLITHAPYPADGENTMLIEENFVHIVNARDNGGVRVINLPKPSIRPLIRKVAVRLVPNEYEYNLSPVVGQAYFARRNGFTGLRTLQVVLVEDGFGQITKTPVDVDLEQEQIGVDFVVSKGLRSLIISLDREQSDCEAILRRYLDICRQQGLA